jgi:hypothetical protein
VTGSSSIQTKTITEMILEDPDVDNRAVFAKMYGVLGGFKDQILERFELSPHASVEPYNQWEGPHGDFKGSLHAWSGSEVEWFVHSWAGNPAKSILDMNLTVWLGPHIDVPHLVLVFGTVPNPYHYSDLLPRVDLPANVEYLDRYYEPENEPFMALRADDRWHWSVSHGSYMRAILTPAAYSFMGARTDEIVDAFCDAATERFNRWLALVDAAEIVPVADRAALQARDHLLRRTCYDRDPMNALAANWLGQDMVDSLVSHRQGAAQMAEVASATRATS